MTTYEKHAAILSFKASQLHSNHEDIIAAVKTLKNSSSTQILQHVNNTRREMNKFTRIIDFRGIEKPIDPKSYNPVTLRTVQRHLNILVKDGFVKRKDGRYSLTNKGKRSVSYFGREFGSRVLNDIIDKPDFRLKTVKENMSDLVTLFGSYILYCCIEATKPATKSIDYDTDETEPYEALESKLSWITSAINPASLLHYFLFTFLNQMDDNLASKLKRLKFSGVTKGKKFIHIDEVTGQKYELDRCSSSWYMFIDDKGKTYIPKQYRDIPYYDSFLVLDRYSSVHTDYEKTPYDKVDKNVYQKLVTVFEELYPEIWKKIKTP